MKRLFDHRDLLLGIVISLVAVAHIPNRFATEAFDRNAAPQFILLMALGFICAIFLIASKNPQLTLATSRALAALIITYLISLSLSDSFYSSLIGDTGRYTGAASFFSLIAVALTVSTFSIEEFRNMLVGAGVGIVLVTLIGFLQSFALIDMPTGGGVGSTLGNLDFLSAWIGTTLIFAYLMVQRLPAARWIFLVYLAIALTTLLKIDAKQGYVDLLIICLGITAFTLLKRMKLPQISTKVLKIVAAFLLLLWSEIIYLVTMANLPLPGIHKDSSVSIRADFWFSAAQMFFKHLGFGVGPDNYGNYYEKYRSLNSVKVTETVLANDAHSAMMQTLGTLGLFTALAFLVVILLVLFALIDLYRAQGERIYLLLLLAFGVFYTNSLISPITLPNKLIFWALCGFAIGQWVRLKIGTAAIAPREVVLTTKLTGVISAFMIAFAAYSFIPSFLHVNQALQANNTGRTFEYQVSAKLPCIVYANTQINLALKSGGSAQAAAEKILSEHPRCLDALAVIVQEHFKVNDFRGAKPYIYQLLDVAPARQSVVRLAALYAVKENDEYMKNLLTGQGIKLGYFTPEDLRP